MRLLKGFFCRWKLDLVRISQNTLTTSFFFFLIKLFFPYSVLPSFSCSVVPWFRSSVVPVKNWVEEFMFEGFFLIWTKNWIFWFIKGENFARERRATELENIGIFHFCVKNFEIKISKKKEKKRCLQGQNNLRGKAGPMVFFFFWKKQTFFLGSIVPFLRLSLV